MLIEVLDWYDALKSEKCLGHWQKINEYLVESESYFDENDDGLEDTQSLENGDGSGVQSEDNEQFDEENDFGNLSIGHS